MSHRDWLHRQQRRLSATSKLRHCDFQIGTEFYTETGKWRCTDVGTRVIVAISLEPRDTSGFAGSRPIVLPWPAMVMADRNHGLC